MVGAGKGVRATALGRVQGVGFRAFTVDRAGDLGVLGWVRNQDDGSVAVHAEGDPVAVDALIDALRAGPLGAQVERVEVTAATVEGHEQFAVRGVPAGRFVVEVLAGERPGFVLRVEVDGVWRSWRLSKAPSMVPADKRFASELAPTAIVGASTASGSADAQAPPTFDAGRYEQGGRVPWPEAVLRGHAVFVLHGDHLRGGFALQRTRGEGPGSGWLLIKRRDEFAER